MQLKNTLLNLMPRTFLKVRRALFKWSFEPQDFGMLIWNTGQEKKFHIMYESVIILFLILFYA